MPYIATGLLPEQEKACTTWLASLPQALAYSLVVFFLRRPLPRPGEEEWGTQLFLNVETVLGPLLVALLVLAIRRRFMR